MLEPERPGLASNLAMALAEASDPCAVLVRLERFLESAEEPGAELDCMASTPRYARMVCTVLDQSHFLTDIVCRWPGYMRWLWQDAILRRARTHEEMLDDLHRDMEACTSLAECGTMMRRFRQREILRIATRDVFMHVPLHTLTEDLSNLADTALEIAREMAWKSIEERFGRPTYTDDAGHSGDVTFVVIGMGKLGGRELNFSSDVDLLFIYLDDGETSGGNDGSVSNAEFFQKLGEHIIRLVSEQTAEGHIFRVDMRLRPHGRLSPLAASLESTINYYVQYGQAWERQALIKARPVAGDQDLGKQFIDRTRSFVFPRYFDDETLDSIREIKQQMESLTEERGETGIEVKLGRGGIRDIEFTVQVLQMLNGGRMLEFRTTNTLDAIKALDIRGILRAFEATALASTYTFLRQVEHRLQIEGSQQRHALPADPLELDRFARRLGYASGESFMVDYRDRTQETRAILDRFLSTEGAGHLWTYDLLSPQSDGEAGKAHLERYGFKEPDKAREELLLLSAGPSRQPYPFHVRQQFAAIAPMLLEALGECPDPDATLVRLERILTNLQAPSAIYDTLKGNPALCGYLVTLVANSDYLSEILTRDPGLFDMFSSRDALAVPRARAELESDLDNLGRAFDPDAAPYRLRDGETLRIGIRELFHNASVMDVGKELSQLAEVILDYAVRKAREDVAQRYGAAQGAFAILALGKLGGREMGYGSDLDLLFVYGADATTESGMAASEYFAAVAASAMRRLKDVTRYGLLYDIDARLRPDGNKGVLAVNDRRMEEYFRTEAQEWERLALMKVRAVAGDLEFGRKAEERLRDAAFDLELTPEALARIEDIRARLAQGASPLDLKKDTGGLVAIEFAVRLLQLRHAGRFPGLKRADVLGALDALESHALVDAGMLRVLRDAYLLFRRIENRIRMMHGRSSSALPESPEIQAELVQRLGIDADLATLVQTCKAKVEEAYLLVRGEMAGT